MTVITGGMIAFEDGKKAAEEYAPPRKARAELRFDVPEGEDCDPHIAAVAAKAQQIVTKMLGGTAIVRTQATIELAPAPQTKAELTAAAAAAAGGTAADANTATTRKPRGPVRAPSGDKAKLEAAAVAAAQPKADPSAVTDDEFAVAAKPDPAAVEDFTVAPAEITDADLNTAVQKKNAALKDPVKIRGLIAQFNPDPAKAFTMREIPQAQRATFVSKLEALS